jgi:hypothetical protein
MEFVTFERVDSQQSIEGLPTAIAVEILRRGGG